jgi:predicted nucleic acid-binding protein
VSLPHFLDTNILPYSISRDPTEAAKRRCAIDLLDRDDGALSVQVLQEFYVQATRSMRIDPLPHDVAAGLIRTWTRFQVQEIDLPILYAALEIKWAQGCRIGTALLSPPRVRLGAVSSIPRTCLMEDGSKVS